MVNSARNHVKGGIGRFSENGLVSNGINWIGLYTLIRREVERSIFRVVTQVIVAPLISAFLFIFIFGFVLGRKIDLIAGIPYIEFVFPGVLMMNILTAAFLSSSSTVYFARFMKTIEEILAAPLSYAEMIVGFVASAIIRALIIALGVLLIGIAFGAVGFVQIYLFLFYAVSIATIFALLGVIVGLWAKGFEQLNILNTFIIMPLSFLGGMFYSVTLLPESVRSFTFFNPFFYFIDGMRFSMTGVSESNLALGATIIVVLIVTLSLLVWYLFKTSWRLRE